MGQLWCPVESRTALCLAGGWQLPSFSCPVFLTSQKGLRLPSPPWSSRGQRCARPTFTALWCWIRGKHVSEAELLRKLWTERTGGTGRASCRGGGCPAGQTDNVKSLDRQASRDQTAELPTYKCKKSKRVRESGNTEGIKSSALASSWEERQGNNNLLGL